MGDYTQLFAYRKAHALAMEIFHVSKAFPYEERFSLTDQIRRSSRSVCASLAESYRKKSYKAHFLLKLTEAATENTETEVWLTFSRDCNYLTEDIFLEMKNKNDEVGKLLWYMVNNVEKFLK